MSNIFLKMLRQPFKPFIIILQALVGMVITLMVIQIAQDEIGWLQKMKEQQVFVLVAGSEKKNSSSGYPLFSFDELSKIKKLSPDVEELALKNWNTTQLIIKDSVKYKVMNAKSTTPGYDRFLGLKMIAGEYLSTQSMIGGDEAVLSSNVSQTLFGNKDSVGKSFLTVNYQGKKQKYKVIGVTESTQGENMIHVGSIYFPFDGKYSRSGQLLVKSKLGKIQQAKKQVKDAANQVYQNNNLFIKNKKALYIEEKRHRKRRDAPTYFVLAALGLGLTVIAMLASQLISVHERTREIGMKRALGATKGRIIVDIILENFILTFIGGALGVVIAYFCWQPFKDLMWIREVFSWPLAFSVFGGLLMASLVFSLFPAFMAERLRPSEAAKAVGS